MGKKYIDNTWDFLGSNTKEYTHCFHNYPAMMIPQIAREIIKRYKISGMKTLFDPYMGTGTSLVEANLRGLDAIGTDLNPLARLISKSKTTILDINKLDKEIKKFTIKMLETELKKVTLKIEKPKITNIDFWFKEKNIIEIALIKEYIDNIKNIKIKNFFLVSLSETIRDVSLTRNNEFKRYRMEEKNIKKHNPFTFSIIEEKLIRNRNGMVDFINDTDKTKKSKIYDFNTCDKINSVIKKGSIDIIVTSPPYGDSGTTVAYGQFSRLASEWLGLENATKIDSLLMGGKKIKERYIFKLDILDDKINKIFELDKKRALEVNTFYYDYKKSIDNISNVVKSKGIVAYVVGNRTVKNIILPTDEITKKFFELNDFEHIETIIRNIPNKRMPQKNSPTNVKGKTVDTMNNEYIVIMKKK